MQAKIWSRLLPLVFGAVVSCTSAWAERYQLFTAPGVQHPDYATIVTQLAAGDVVVFSNGDQFTVKGTLGSGGTTLILDLGNRGLRIPLSSGNYTKTFQEGTDYLRVEYEPFTWYITQFIAGQRILKKYEVPVVEIFSSLENEYVEVEKVKPIFSYGEYLASERSFLTPEVRARVDDQLLSWLAKAAIFRQIGDFHSAQLVYVGSRWLVIDHADGMLLSRYYNDQAPFVVGRWNRLMAWMGRHPGLTLPPDLHDRARDVIYETRRSVGQSRGFWVTCGQTLDFFSELINMPRELRRQRAAQPNQ